jgi:CRP-like cAMP-binding protein
LWLGRTVAVSKTARYATVPFDVVRDLAHREPELLIALGASCAQRTRGLASTLAAQVSKPILVRVAGALLPYAPPAQGLDLALPPLPTMTQSQIAAAAGTVKEVAARAISELERMGAVRRERGHVRYLNRSKLLETIGT